MSLYSLIRPLLFRLDPEFAHRLTLASLASATRCGYTRVKAQRTEGKATQVMGLMFPNPVGLAAGLDKNGDYIDALAALGFGFLEVGTVTPRPQPGNPKPRLFRIPEARAIINRMGFNNRGVDYLVDRLKTCRYRGILGINIGKNFDTPIENAGADYLISMRKVYPYASYITINVSSPNTKNLRDLQQPESLRNLLQMLKAERADLERRYGKKVPLAVKVAPDLSHDDIDSLAAIFLETRIDAVIATNTTLARDSVAGLHHGNEAGGLSGGPLFDPSTRVLAALAERLAPEIPLIASGGILTADDARKKKAAGASLVQIYSGLIYTGPELIDETIRAFREDA
ncbi:MAG: quinone-dependent dihydroorotate dehydrogenase [Gammaproteobacteria bacterium]